VPWEENGTVPFGRSRRGHTLLELVAAAAILAITVVPALRMVGTGLENGVRIENQGLVTMLAGGKLEEQLCVAGAAWTNVTLTGSFASEGYSYLRFRVVRSDAPADGGIVNRLMAITATVWHDADSDAVQDAGETSATFATKVARMAKYQTVAGS
jgi:hypothetical protein